MSSNKEHTNIDLRVMVIQPTKSGIEEIAHERVQVPYMQKVRNQEKSQAKSTMQKVEKPKTKTVEKPKTKSVTKKTKEKTERAGE